MPSELTQTAKAPKNAEIKAVPDTTRERLLLVAEELFARKGFAGTSIREIGSVLGIANSSILYYFPSKNKLYAEVLKRIADSLKTVIDDLPKEDGNPSERLLAMVDRLMIWCQHNTGYLQIIVRELMENPDRIAHAKHWYLADVVEKMRQQVELMKNRGTLSAIDPALFLIHFIGSITYFSIAFPTVSKITGNNDMEDLQRKFKETIFHVINSCLAGSE